MKPIRIKVRIETEYINSESNNPKEKVESNLLSLKNKKNKDYTNEYFGIVKKDSDLIKNQMSGNSNTSKIINLTPTEIKSGKASPKRALKLNREEN